jgi:hypothetical protein
VAGATARREGDSEFPRRNADDHSKHAALSDSAFAAEDLALLEKMHDEFLRIVLEECLAG